MYNWSVTNNLLIQTRGCLLQTLYIIPIRFTITLKFSTSTVFYPIFTYSILWLSFFLSFCVDTVTKQRISPWPANIIERLWLTSWIRESGMISFFRMPQETALHIWSTGRRLFPVSLSFALWMIRLLPIQSFRHRLCIQSKLRIFINLIWKADRIMGTRSCPSCFLQWNHSELCRYSVW